MGNQEFLQKILSEYSSIRFVCIFDKYGVIKEKQYKDNLSPVLDEFDSETLVREAASTWNYRKYLGQKLGKGHFSMTVYDKLTRITMPLDEDLFILLSTEESIKPPNSLQHILEFLEKNKMELTQNI